ncbi:unnamed protein product [Arabis nemorensis]|uniref:Uncharacterized protein n=1 Tax=Arabis nemorensis TaxID=586526 RepID=A0A565ANM7_9BRAS|nr:unnamed protein product [Arabis nemorensis]
MVGNCKSTKGISMAVVDANAVIEGGQSLTNFADKFVTLLNLQTRSDVDLKLIALTYTLEAQVHGTKNLRDVPPPIQTRSVKRLPEKELPRWSSSNVAKLEEWEALEKCNSNSEIFPLKDRNVNIIP